MAASATDYFTKVGSPGTATTLAAPGHSIAGTSITVVSTSNWDTTTGIIFAIDTFTTQTVNGVSTAVRTPGSYTEWEGTVASSTSITGMILRYGTDQNYSAGANTRVYIPVASSRENRIVDGLILAGLTQAGGMGAIAPTSVASTGAVSGTAGTFSSDVSDNGTTLKTIRTEYQFDFVASGLVWSGDAYASTRNASMTAGVVYINGQRGSISAVTARSFTASKDTYVDILNTAGVFTVVYTEVTNNAASPALAANSLRIGIIVTGASNIAAATSVNQGQETMVLPIASSVPYAVTDSLGNLICPRDSNRKTLGHRMITSNFTTTATSATQLTGLSVPVIVPTGRKLRITVFSAQLTHSAASSQINITIWDGTVGSGTQLNLTQAITGPTTVGTGVTSGYCFVMVTPATTSKTYNVGLHTAAGTATFSAGSTFPGSVLVELV